MEAERDNNYGLDDRATCPICLRRITVDGSRYLYKHMMQRSSRPGQSQLCLGSGMQPLDQLRLNLNA